MRGKAAKPLVPPSRLGQHMWSYGFAETKEA